MLRSVINQGKTRLRTSFNRSCLWYENWTNKPCMDIIFIQMNINAGPFIALKTKVAAYMNHLSQVYQYHNYQSFSQKGYNIKKMVWTINFYKHSRSECALLVQRFNDILPKVRWTSHRSTYNAWNPGSSRWTKFNGHHGLSTFFHWTAQEITFSILNLARGTWHWTTHLVPR